MDLIKLSLFFSQRYRRQDLLFWNGYLLSRLNACCVTLRPLPSRWDLILIEIGCFFTVLYWGSLCIVWARIRHIRFCLLRLCLHFLSLLVKCCLIVRTFDESIIVETDLSTACSFRSLVFSLKFGNAWAIFHLIPLHLSLGASKLNGCNQSSPFILAY